MGIAKAYFYLALSALLLVASSSSLGQPKIDNVYPTLGLLGESLDVEVTGSGFDANTRVSISLDSANANQRLGTLQVINPNRLVAVAGKAYISAFSAFYIADFSTLSEPVILGYLGLKSGVQASGLVVVGQSALLATNVGLEIVDITNPATPTSVSSLNLARQYLDIVVENDRAYLVGESGLTIVDISNLNAPIVLGSFETSTPADRILVENDLAYVVGRRLFQIIDVGDSLNPRLIGELVDTASLYNDATGIALENGIAYISGGYLYSYDVTDPENPHVVGAISTNSGITRDVVVQGGRIYLVEDGGLRVLELDTSGPRDIGFYSSDCLANDVEVVSNIALLVACDVNIFDVKEVVPANVISNVDTLGFSEALAVVDSIAYVVGQSGLTIFDVSAPSAPVELGFYRTLHTPREITVVGNRAYITDSNNFVLNSATFSILDVSSPFNPTLLGTTTLPNLSTSKIAVSGNVAYIGSNPTLSSTGSELSLFDISNESEPVLIGSVETSRIEGLDVQGNYAYVADAVEGILVIDIANPANPRIAGSLGLKNIKNVVVAGTRLYGANDNAFYVIDISNPLNPVLVSSIGFSASPLNFSFHGLVVEGATAYITSVNQGVVVVDLSNESSPVVTGMARTLGTAAGVAVVGDIAVVADNGAGLTIIPLPVEVDSVVVSSPSRISLTLPSAVLEGNYTLRVFNSSQHDELYGAVSFVGELPTFSIASSSSEPVTPLPAPAVNATSKAIIVAGGGPYPGNNLWPSTIRSADFAYRSLLYQGYTRENIYYLSPDTQNDADGDGQFNDVDASATTENLQDAILNWATDPAAPAYELLLFIVDHGGDSQFRLNQTTLLSAQQLDGWLDTLQQTMPGKLMVVYDACQSGTFIPHMSAPPGAGRIVITSAADENAYFVNDGGLSFSYQFWTSVLSGGSVLDSFVFGRNMMTNFQTAQLDANGNGIANEKADSAAVSELIIGRGYVPASDKPLISFISPPQTLSGSLSATISASGIIDATGIQRVWATVSRPDFDPGSPDDPVLDLPEIELSDPDGDNVWVGSYDQFDVIGNYTITIHALNNNGFYSAPDEVFPNTTLVSQTVGISAPGGQDTDGDGIPDSLDDDDDNDGVRDQDDVFPLIDSITGNLSSSEDAVFSSASQTLTIPMLYAQLREEGILRPYYIRNLQLRFAPECSGSSLAVEGDVSFVDPSAYSGFNLAEFDSETSQLRVPAIEVSSRTPFAGPEVSRYEDVVLALNPACAGIVFDVLQSTKTYP